MYTGASSPRTRNMGTRLPPFPTLFRNTHPHHVLVLGTHPGPRAALCGPDLFLCSPKTTPSTGAGLPAPPAPSSQHVHSRSSAEPRGGRCGKRELAHATPAAGLPAGVWSSFPYALGNDRLRQLHTVSRRTHTSKMRRFSTARNGREAREAPGAPNPRLPSGGARGPPLPSSHRAPGLGRPPKATQTPDPAEEDLGRGWRDKAPRPRLRLARQALPGLGPPTGSHPHFQVVVVKPPIT